MGKNRIGMEYTTHFRFSTAGDPDKAVDDVASTYYGGDDDDEGKPEKDGDGYYFNGGEVYVEPGNWQLVSKSVYDAATILTEL